LNEKCSGGIGGTAAASSVCIAVSENGDAALAFLGVVVLLRPLDFPNAKAIAVSRAGTRKEEDETGERATGETEERLRVATSR
jgi:hypothetical protein